MKLYIPILVLAILAFGFAAFSVTVGTFAGPKRWNKAKLEAYECGIKAASDSRGRYTVRFYIIAILFVIFDVETIFLFPWAVTYGAMGLYGLVSMFVFLGILIIGYIWLYKKGALDWV